MVFPGQNVSRRLLRVASAAAFFFVATLAIAEELATDLHETDKQQPSAAQKPATAQDPDHVLAKAAAEAPPAVANIPALMSVRDVIEKFPSARGDTEFTFTPPTSTSDGSPGALPDSPKNALPTKIDGKAPDLSIARAGMKYLDDKEFMAGYLNLPPVSQSQIQAAAINNMQNAPEATSPKLIGLTPTEAIEANKFFLYLDNKLPELFKPAAPGTRKGDEQTQNFANRSNDFLHAQGDAGGPTTLAESQGYAGQFLDLAKNQLGPFVDPNLQNPYQLQGTNPLAPPPTTDFGLNLPSLLSPLQVNTADLNGNGLNQSLASLDKLMKTPAFMEQISGVIGPQAASLLQDSISAAQALQKQGKDADASFIAGLVANANGGLTKPLLGIVNNKNRPKISKELEAILGKGGEGLDKKTLEWIERARELSKKKHADDLNTLWTRGMLELEKLIADLRTFRALNLLKLVQLPQQPPMWKLYNDALTKISDELRSRPHVRELASTRLTLSPTDEAKYAEQLKQSAQRMLKTLTLCKDTHCTEETLENFFFDSDERSLWKEHDLSQYESLRELGALVKMARRLSLLDYPAAEKPTRERYALAFVVRAALKDLQASNHKKSIIKKFQEKPNKNSIDPIANEI